MQTATITLAEIKRLYVVEKLSTVAIGARVHMHPETVRRRLHAAGVRLRPVAKVAGRKVSADEMERVIELYERHQNTRVVAEIVGVHQTTVQHRLAQDGVDTSRKVGGTPTPPAPEGYELVADVAARLGTTVGAISGRCYRGSIPGARRETTWPTRWLIPVGAFPSTEVTR